MEDFTHPRIWEILALMIFFFIYELFYELFPPLVLAGRNGSPPPLFLTIEEFRFSPFPHSGLSALSPFPLSVERI